jgi:predicted transcriptional regulator
VKISEIVEKTGLEALNAYEDAEIPGVYVSDMASDVITGAKAGAVLVTLQTHKNFIAAANLVDAGMVVFAHGKRPADDVIALADRVGLPLFTTPDDTWTYALKLADIGLR